MVDESRSDGIDNDGDWDPFTDLNDNGVWDEGEPLNDDLGADGVGPFDLSYRGPDTGEGDGLPTDGEPDFDKTDKDESDQIGLTSFAIFPVHFYELIDEEQNWWVMNQIIDPTQEQLLGVNLGMYFFSGPFPLSPGQTERFSMSLLFGNDRDDLLRNKKTVQAIYNANYNFAQPPLKPVLTATPGDGKVTLTWDEGAEYSYDRFLQEYDFEGYRVLRSTDPSFIDTKIITDAYGNPAFRKPMAQYDKVDGLYGPHLVGVHGAQFDLGSETGLRHSFIDNTVRNGVTYYYAVVSYDYGYLETVTITDTLTLIRDDQEVDSVVVYTYPIVDDDGQIMGIAPTECTSTIKGQAGLTPEFIDINCAMVTPNAPAAGYIQATIKDGVIRHSSGGASGEISVNIVLPDSIKDDHTYLLTFETADNYGDFLRFTRNYVIIDSTTGDTVATGGYPQFGAFKHYEPGDPVFWIERTTAKRRWKYFAQDPTDTANLLFWELADAQVESPMVDGFTILMQNAFIDYKTEDSPQLDTVEAEIVSDLNYNTEIIFHPQLGNFNLKLPYSYEIRWYDEIVDTSVSRMSNSFRETPVPFTMWNLTLDEPAPFIYRERNESWTDHEGVEHNWVDEYWIFPTVEFAEEENISIFGPGIHMTAPGFQIDTTIVQGDTLIDSTFVEKIPPGPGDVISWKSPVPFADDDVYSFTVNGSRMDRQKEKDDLERVAVVPNPYVATAGWESKVGLGWGRGQRKIDFIHLPRKCTIRIYTISGYLVKELSHESTELDGSESWNLVSKDGMDIAYGIYLFHVDAPGVGEKSVNSQWSNEEQDDELNVQIFTSACLFSHWPVPSVWPVASSRCTDLYQ